MDTSAGIALRPSASQLCALNGGDPRVIASARGFREFLRPPSSVPPQPPRRSGLAALFGRLTGASTSPESPPSPFPFEHVAELLRGLMHAMPSSAPRRVAIAVPAWANDVQRQQVADGAHTAGWDFLGLVNEPTAAAMASGLLQHGEGTALVYDLAEGRFDVTVVAFRGTSFEVLAADGLLKCDDNPTLPELLARTETPCHRALAQAGYRSNAIDTVVLVGETARNPQTVEFVTRLFGQPPLTRFDPEEVVGFGAAVHASILESR